VRFQPYGPTSVGGDIRPRDSLPYSARILLFAIQRYAGRLECSLFHGFCNLSLAEFERLPKRDTQRVLLPTLRVLLRYLSDTGAIPKDEAPPGMTTRRHVHLPRQLSREQVEALFDASLGKKTRTEGQGAFVSFSSAGTTGILRVTDNGKNPFS
jgi:hypothetical protein